MSAQNLYNNVVECLIKREGPTIFFIGKIQYIFAPRPELTGDNEASVCVVVSQEHRDYLTKDRMCSQYYRMYEPKVKVVGAAEALEMEEFKAWQLLRKTMSAEEIMAMEQGRIAGTGAAGPTAGTAATQTPTSPRKNAAKTPAVETNKPADNGFTPPETGVSDEPMAEIF